MKRWIIFLGRGGTVLITICLALLLVSLIPPILLGSFGGGGINGPETFELQLEHVLTPQQRLQVTITANGTLNVYLVEVSSDRIYEWMSVAPWKLTRLEEFLDANADLIGWQGETREAKIDYIPTKVTNVTLILSNPTSDFVHSDYEGSITSVVAPGTKVRNLAQWTIPIGFVFVLPWLTQMWKRKTIRKSP